MSTNSRRLRKKEGATVATILDSEQFIDASISSSTPVMPYSTVSLSRKSLSKLGSLAKAMSTRTSFMFQRKSIPTFPDQEPGLVIIQSPLPTIIVTPADPAIYASPPLETVTLEPASSPMVRSDHLVKWSGEYGEFMMTGPAPSMEASYTSPVASDDEGHSSAESSGLGTPCSTRSEEHDKQSSNESGGGVMSPVSMGDASEANGKVSIDTLASHEIAILLTRQTSDPQFSSFYRELRLKTSGRSNVDLVSNTEDRSQDEPLQTVQFSPTIDTVLRIVNQPLTEADE